ncbi:hypothetical protein SDC9_81703 [bioreactor metagenome]|uniref:Uncharacterized protein n=1 Tax=bioreactor metagenome TaxID=1076179 RepID=A0A644Z8S1_9ZZZZ
MVRLQVGPQVVHALPLLEIHHGDVVIAAFEEGVADVPLFLSREFDGLSGNLSDGVPHSRFRRKGCGYDNHDSSSSERDNVADRHGFCTESAFCPADLLYPYRTEGKYSEDSNPYHTLKRF